MRAKCLIVAKDVEVSSGCINIYPMLSADQFIIRKVDLEMSQRRRRVMGKFLFSFSKCYNFFNLLIYQGYITYSYSPDI